MPRRTVVNCDIARFSTLGVTDARVQELITGCCRKSGILCDPLHYQCKGDGALVFVESPLLAELLAEMLHTEAHTLLNPNKSGSRGWCSFRVGVATGDLDLENGIWLDPTGRTLRTAERLQAECGTGQILIDRQTYEAIPPRWQVHYAGVPIRGKSHDPRDILAYRRSVVPSAPWEHRWRTRRPEWQYEFCIGLGAIEALREDLHQICAMLREPQQGTEDYVPVMLSTAGKHQEVIPLSFRVNRKLADLLSPSKFPCFTRVLVKKEAGVGLWDLPDELPGGSRHDYLWVVDGIDGSRHILRNMAFFTTTMALVEARTREAVIGLTFVPITGETFFAVREEGAFLNDWGRPLRVSSRKLGQSVVYVESPVSDKSDSMRLEREISQMKNLTKTVKRIRGFGLGSLGLAYVAKGAFEAYVDFSHTSYLHNMAAGCLLVREAGGMVSNLGSREVPRFIAGTQGVVRGIRTALQRGGQRGEGKR